MVILAFLKSSIFFTCISIEKRVEDNLLTTITPVLWSCMFICTTGTQSVTFTYQSHIQVHTKEIPDYTVVRHSVILQVIFFALLWT